MSSVSHIFNVLSVFSWKTSQQLTQKNFHTCSTSFNSSQNFLNFSWRNKPSIPLHHNIHRNSLSPVQLIQQSHFLLSNSYNNPTFSNRPISFHCFLYLSPHQHVHHPCKARLQHNCKNISKNFQTYNRSMFHITQYLGSY